MTDRRENESQAARKRDDPDPISFNFEWLRLLSEITLDGDEVSPRGQRTKELPSQLLLADMKRPVLTVAERKLNYKFMAAEAHWILSGSNLVEPVARYNKRIADFSDDGQTFFGAYGPKLAEQLPYVVAKLIEDPGTRQAGLTFWRESPAKTKDVPCTVATFFSMRELDGRTVLHSHVFMRSSDAWLGVPYDVFNFAMINHRVCAHVNLQRRVAGLPYVEPGTLYLTAASSHLYETNWAAAQTCLVEAENVNVSTPECPRFWNEHPETQLEILAELRESKPGDPSRWWEDNEC